MEEPRSAPMNTKKSRPEFRLESLQYEGGNSSQEDNGDVESDAPLGQIDVKIESLEQFKETSQQFGSGAGMDTSKINIENLIRINKELTNTKKHLGTGSDGERSPSIPSSNSDKGANGIKQQS